jgi:hypothetical protein
MKKLFSNPAILQRFDELIAEGQKLSENSLKSKRLDPISYTQWATSCLNLLDKLSISTNRFVQEFEKYNSIQKNSINVGLPLGVLQSAQDEYVRGLAIDYHLSVSATVFGDLLSESRYLLEKGYIRAAAILARASLEETLRARARTIPNKQISSKIKLFDLLRMLKEDGFITEFDEKRIDAHKRVGDAAAHGDEFPYTKDDVEKLILEAEDAVANYLGRG